MSLMLFSCDAADNLMPYTTETTLLKVRLSLDFGCQNSRFVLVLNITAFGFRVSVKVAQDRTGYSLVSGWLLEQLM